MDETNSSQQSGVPTKAQKYLERKQAKEAARRGRQKSQYTGKIIRWVLLAALVAGGIYGLTKIPQSGNSGDSGTSLADQVAANDWVRGKTDSPVTLVEYSDFQCPACGSYHPIMKQLETEYGDRVRFVSRNFPLRQHQFADLAARSAEAAGLQGKFWEMHDKLFENQAAWSVESNPQESFTRYATELGLNIDQWKNDLDNAKIREKITKDYASGVRSKVNATPTFFLNGKKINQPRGLDDFKKALDTALGQ